MNRDRHIEILSSYEDQLLVLGDLKTAVKLNWLRNSVRFGGLDVDRACELMQEIVYNKKIKNSL